jgi:thioredoxin 1
MIEDLDASLFEQKVIGSPLPVMIEFKSDWSGSCHIVDCSLNELADEFKDKFAFFAVDYDTCNLLVEKYRVHKLPTVLFFSNGELVDQLAGPNSKNVVREKIVDIIVRGRK